MILLLSDGYLYEISDLFTLQRHNLQHPDVLPVPCLSDTLLSDI
jgi:hypothetical protein